MRNNPKYPNFIKENILDLRKELSRYVNPLNASWLSWIRVLFHCAYCQHDEMLNVACIDWLKGGSIDTHEANEIGIRNNDIPSTTASTRQLNGICMERIIDISNLAGFYRPFVICFDQTESYGMNSSLVDAFGECFSTLFDRAYNQMIIVTSNVDPWRIRIQPNLQQAYIDRLLRPPLELEGLNRQQAAELIQMRLDGINVDEGAEKYINNSDWLDKKYLNKHQIGVRHFLNDCSDQWLEYYNKPKNPPTMQGLYEKNFADVKSQPKKLVYNQDAFYWLVLIAGKDLKGVTVKEETSEPNGYFILKWKTKNKIIWYGFEEGSNWSRWRAIKREAKRYYQNNNKYKAVLFRTPELPKIPKNSWIRAREPIEAAKREFLHILTVSEEEMINIYAAYELYLDAMGGNINYSADAVLIFLHDRLKDIWEAIQSPPPFPNGKKNGNGDPPEELIKEVETIVKKEKFLSFKDLMAKLSSTYPEKTVYKAIGCIPNIKVIPGPKMTVLQWQSKR